MFDQMEGIGVVHSKGYGVLCISSIFFFLRFRDPAFSLHLHPRCEKPLWRSSRNSGPTPKRRDYLCLTQLLSPALSILIYSTEPAETMPSIMWRASTELGNLTSPSIRHLLPHVTFESQSGEKKMFQGTGVPA